MFGYRTLIFTASNLSFNKYGYDLDQHLLFVVIVLHRKM